MNRQTSLPITDIATYQLNWPRGQFSENMLCALQIGQEISSFGLNSENINFKPKMFGYTYIQTIKFVHDFRNIPKI